MMCFGLPDLYAPVKGAARKRKVLQAATHKACDFVEPFFRQNEIRNAAIKIKQLVRIFGKLEEIALLLHPFDWRAVRAQPLAVGIQPDFALVVIGLVANGIPAGIFVEINIPCRLHALPDGFGGAVMARFRGANEIVVRAVELLHHGLEGRHIRVGNCSGDVIGLAGRAISHSVNHEGWYQPCVASASRPKMLNTKGLRSRLYISASRAAALIRSDASARRANLAKSPWPESSRSASQPLTVSRNAASGCGSVPASASPSACKAGASRAGNPASKSSACRRSSNAPSSSKASARATEPPAAPAAAAISGSSSSASIAAAAAPATSASASGRSENTRQRDRSVGGTRAAEWATSTSNARLGGSSSTFSKALAPERLRSSTESIMAIRQPPSPAV